MTDTKSLETQLSMESGHNVDVIEAEVKAIVDALGDFCAQGDSWIRHIPVGKDR